MYDNKAIATRKTDQRQPGTDNQVMIYKALNDHRRPGFPSLPDFARRRMIQGHMRKELEKGFSFRLEKLSMELETSLQQIREESNHSLVTSKAKLRKERMQLFANTYHEVVEKLNELTERFLTDLDKRFERLQEYKSKVIREREEKRLNKSVDNFLTTLDQLTDEYREIISEHVGREKRL